MKLSEYVKTYRTFNKLSLRAMADKCNCSFQYLAKLENDEVNSPSLEMIKKIADGTDVSVHELLSLVDNVDVQVTDPKQIDRRISILQAEMLRLQEARYDGYFPEGLSVIIENDNEKALLESFRNLTDKQQEAVLTMVSAMVKTEEK